MEMKLPGSSPNAEEKVETANEVSWFQSRGKLSPPPLQRVSSSPSPYLSSENVQAGEQSATSSLPKLTNSPSPRPPLHETPSTFCSTMTEEKPSHYAIHFGSPPIVLRPYPLTAQTRAGVPFQEGSGGEVEVVVSKNAMNTMGVQSSSRKTNDRRHTPPSPSLSASSFSSSSSRTLSSTPCCCSCCGGTGGVRQWICRCVHAICTGHWRDAVFSLVHFSRCPSHHGKHHSHWWTPGKIAGGEADEENSEEEEDLYKRESDVEKRALLRALPIDLPTPAERTGVESAKKVSSLSRLFSHAIGKRRDSSASSDEFLCGIQKKTPRASRNANGRKNTTKAGRKNGHVASKETRGTPLRETLAGPIHTTELCGASPCGGGGGEGGSAPHRSAVSPHLCRGKREGKISSVDGSKDRREGSTWSEPPIGSSSSSFLSSYPPSPITPYVSSFSDTSRISSLHGGGGGGGHVKEQEERNALVPDRWMVRPTSSGTVDGVRAGVPLSPLSAVRQEHFPFGISDPSFLHPRTIAPLSFSSSEPTVGKSASAHLPPFSTTPQHGLSYSSSPPTAASTAKKTMETRWPPLPSSSTREDVVADAIHIRHYGYPPEGGSTAHAKSRRRRCTSAGSPTSLVHMPSVPPPHPNASEDAPPVGWVRSIEILQAFLDRYASFLPFRLRVSREEDGGVTPPAGWPERRRRMDEVNGSAAASEKRGKEEEWAERQADIHPLQLCLQGPLRTDTPFSSLLSVIEDVLLEDCDPQFPITTLTVVDMHLPLSRKKGENGAGKDETNASAPLHGDPSLPPASTGTVHGRSRNSHDGEWGKNVPQHGVLLDCLLGSPTFVGGGGSTDGAPPTAIDTQTDTIQAEERRHRNAGGPVFHWSTSCTEVSLSTWHRPPPHTTGMRHSPSLRRDRSGGGGTQNVSIEEEVFTRVTIFLGNILDNDRYRLDGRSLPKAVGLTTICLRRVTCSPSDFPLLCGVLPFDEEEDWTCAPSSHGRVVAPNGSPFHVLDQTRKEDSRTDPSYSPSRHSSPLPTASLSVLPLHRLLVEQCALTAVHIDELLWMTRQRRAFLSPAAPLSVVRQCCFFALLEELQLSGPLTQDCVEKLLRAIQEEAELLESAARTARSFLPTPISFETTRGTSSSVYEQNNGVEEDRGEESVHTENDHSSAIATSSFQLSLRVIRLPRVLLSVARRDPFVLSHPNIRVESLKSTEQQ